MAVGQLQNEGDLERWIKSRLQVWLAPFLRRVARLGGIDFGSGAFTFTASAQSANLTTPHGLTVPPSVVVAMADNAAINVSLNPGTVGASTFDLVGRHVDGTAITSSTIKAYWLAVV